MTILNLYGIDKTLLFTSIIFLSGLFSNTPLLPKSSLFNFTVQGVTDFDMSSIDYVDEHVTISLNITSDNLMIIEQESFIALIQ